MDPIQFKPHHKMTAEEHRDYIDLIWNMKTEEIKAVTAAKEERNAKIRQQKEAKAKELKELNAYRRAVKVKRLIYELERKAADALMVEFKKESKETETEMKEVEKMQLKLTKSQKRFVKKLHNSSELLAEKYSEIDNQKAKYAEKEAEMHKKLETTILNLEMRKESYEKTKQKVADKKNLLEELKEKNAQVQEKLKEMNMPALVARKAYLMNLVKEKNDEWEAKKLLIKERQQVLENLKGETENKRLEFEAKKTLIEEKAARNKIMEKEVENAKILYVNIAKEKLQNEAKRFDMQTCELLEERHKVLVYLASLKQEKAEKVKY